MELKSTHRAMVFPGQGSQYVGMGKKLAEQHPLAKEVFQEVDDALGAPLFKLMCEGPEQQLILTKNAQPALMANSMAVVRVIEAETQTKISDLVDYVAGHSLGEYSALAATNSISLYDAAKLLRLRGESMQAAVPIGDGAMAALLGAGMDAVTKIITEASKIGICEIANDNAPGQIVISGEAKAVNKAIKISSDFGVRKAMSLPVSAPFHCSMMKPAAEVMAAALEKTDINSPDVPLVTNVSALVGNGDPSEIRNSLVEQVTSLVRWRESVLWLSKQNISSVIEIGAGKILSGLNKRIDKQLTSVSIAELEEIDNFLIKVRSGE